MYICNAKLTSKMKYKYQISVPKRRTGPGGRLGLLFGGGFTMKQPVLIGELIKELLAEIRNNMDEVKAKESEKIEMEEVN